MSLKKFVIIVSLLCAFLAAGVSFYASADPDGLERVAQDIGFIDDAKDSATSSSPLADYSFAGIENERLSVAVAGLTGVAVTGLFGAGLTWWVRKPEVTSTKVDAARG
jgi:cobalt/nickel transport protein